jgi:hypothetical protein
LKRKQWIALGALLVVALIFGLALEFNTSMPRGTNVSTVASNGLSLSTFINATEITVGQKLNISVSLFNTGSTVSTLEQADNWTFQGVTVATWNPCYWQTEMPINVVVLNGNYTAEELPSVANASLAMASYTSPIFPTFYFEPNSDKVNITYIASGSGHGGFGPLHVSSNFTVTGFWNLTGLSMNSSYICEPATLHFCEPPTSIPFVQGVYTVRVADEWGQFNVLHFRVIGPS